MKRCWIHIVVLIAAAFYWTGCGTTPPKTEIEPAPRKPEITLQIASINLAPVNKRVERNAVSELAKILKNEQIEILAVQGITRYPGIAARVDFVSELSAKTEWRNVFGEMLNVSGKQTGNAIFSVYPILSHQNTGWDKIIASSFDAALQATVDAGARSLTVISTQLPSKTSAMEQAQISKLMAGMNTDMNNQPMIVAGNLPAEESDRTTNSFAEVPAPETAKKTASRIWYSSNTSIQLLSSRSVEVELGTLVIAQFGLLRQQK
jgi:endonuclease/exonuclease/phosphatase family metal-dependent hydrolase